MNWHAIQTAVIGCVLGAAVLYTLYGAFRTDLPWARWRVWGLCLCRLVLIACLGAWFLDFRFAREIETPKVEVTVLVDRSPSIGASGTASANALIEKASALAAAKDGTISVLELGGPAERTTPLAEALNGSRARFPGKGEKRLLLLSDGRYTTGDPLREAELLAREGIRVFAVPIQPLDNEALVSGLNVPAAAWRSAPVPVEVALRSTHATTCTLTLFQDDEKKDERRLKLEAGVTMVQMSALFDKDGLHRVEARAEFGEDRLPWNNSASALVTVPLAPRVLIISSNPRPDHPLSAALEKNGFTVRLVGPDKIPDQFACDCIVLDNIGAKAIGEARLKAIEGFVKQGGAIMFTGGRQAFGLGEYRDTPLEAVFPVLLDPLKEYPPFVLGIVLDNSWSMNESLSKTIGKIDLAKEIAIAAMEGLNKDDWLALVSFDSDYHVIIPATLIDNLETEKYEVSRIGAFGMTNIYGALAEILKILKKIDAAYKHVVLVSDGKETEEPDYGSLLAEMEQAKITISTIGVGSKVNDKLLNTLAFSGKGRFFHAKNPQQIPSLALQEAKDAKRDELLMEKPLKIQKADAQMSDPVDQAVKGIDLAALPPVAGYNRARMRTHAWTPLVIMNKNKTEPLLARMRYGQGQSLAFLSSATPLWVAEWLQQSPQTYAAFWRQCALSVIGPPHRLLAPAVEYDEGRPVFIFDSLGDAGALSLNRLASDGKVQTDKLTGPMARVDSAGAAAIDLVAEGAATRVFSWSRNYAREFGDPLEGAALLEKLCKRTGGVFKPGEEALFSPGHAKIHSEVRPSLWLGIGVGLLLLELLIRRLPAFFALFVRIRRRKKHGN